MPGLEKINTIAQGRARILIAPLDWGLGHATRCVPIINAFQAAGAEVVVACNQRQAHLFRSEIPSLGIIQLEGYGLRYARSKWLTRIAILFQIPKILTAIKRENKWLNAILRNEKFDVIISDNRYGLHNSGLYSIFITHQLRVSAPFSTILEDLLQKWNYRFIQRFNECWVPDFESESNLAGVLSHPKLLPAITVKYIGAISRFSKSANTLSKSSYLVILLSGPEPQRTIFENLIISELKEWNGIAKVLRGLPEEFNNIASFNNITFYNHVPTSELSDLVEGAEYIISRSGYSTIMDIVSLRKKSILIPTPGQTEQEYLASWLTRKKFSIAFDEKNFSLKNAIEQAKNFEYADLTQFSMKEYEKVVNEFMKEQFKETVRQHVSTNV